MKHNGRPAAAGLDLFGQVLVFVPSFFASLLSALDHFNLPGFGCWLVMFNILLRFLDIFSFHSIMKGFIDLRKRGKPDYCHYNTN